MIFVDTSFFFAAVEPGDRNHEEALALFNRSKGMDLVTTSHVRGETWTLMRYRSGFRTASRFLDSSRASQTFRVEPVSAESEAEAIDWLLARDERAYSFVDATSFAFMREQRIGEALTFDGDFAAAGFVELRA